MRRRKVVTADADALLALDSDLARQHALWTGNGYQLTVGRLWRCKDGSWTARLVWRHPTAIVSTVTFVLRGLGSFVTRAMT